MDPDRIVQPELLGYGAVQCGRPGAEPKPGRVVGWQNRRHVRLGRRPRTATMKHEQGQMVFVFRLQDGQATMDLDGKRKLTLDLEAVQTLPLGEDGRLSPEATAYMVQMTETVADGEVGRRA